MSDTDFEGATVAAQIAARFDEALLDEDSCRRFLLPVIRPAMICGGCGVSYSETEVERTLAGRVVICGNCGKKNAPRVGTVLDGVHASFRQVLLTAILLHFGVSKCEAARRAGISDDTVRRLQNRLGAR